MDAIKFTRRKFFIVAAGLTGASIIGGKTGPIAVAAPQERKRFEFKTGVSEACKMA